MPEIPAPITVANADERRKIVNRLRRLEGQVRGLHAMIESGKECEAILTQVMAVKSALNQVGMHVIGHAMKTCLVDESLTARDDLITAAFDVYLHYRELSAATEAATPRDTSPEFIKARLRALEAQVQSVQKVIETEGDCESALRGVTESTATLNDVARAVLGHAMQKCLIDDAAQSRDDVIDQAIQVFLRYSSCVK